MSRLARHLSFANVVAVIALFCALGGVTYAATQLPRQSVGVEQLKPKAVTAPKLDDNAVITRALADEAVTPRTLSGSVADGLAHAIAFSATGTDAGTDPETVLDLDGLHLTASCQKTGGQTSMSVNILSDRDATVQDSFITDSGTDLGNPGPVQQGTLQIPLQAGQLAAAAQPPVLPGTYFRAVADLIYGSGNHVITAKVVTVENGSTGRCTAYGTAISASA